MKFSSHLDFNGNCDEAMEFYAKTFGATISFRMTWGESPMSDQVDANFQDKIMHTSLVLASTVIMGADAPPDRYRKPQGIVIAIEMDDADEAKIVFDTMAEGGQVTMPFTETFWAKGFGMLTDKFDIPWMVNCAKAM